MMKTVSTVFIILLASFSLSHAEPNMKEGKWEITTRMEMPGMPMTIPPMTHTQCITKKNMVPQDTNPEQKCKMNDVKTNGNTISWVITCDSGQGGPTSGKGTITYAGTTMKGTITMKQSGMEMTSHINGVYIGKCD